MTIDVFTTAYSSATNLKWMKELFENMSALSREARVKFKCFIDEGSTPPEMWSVIGEIEPMNPVLKYGTGLNRCLNYIDGDYVIFVHSDIQVFYEGWDLFVRKMLDKHEAMGAPYPNGLWNKYPSPVFFACKSDSYLQYDMDWNPVMSGDRIIRKKIKRKDESSMFGVEIGGSVKMQTGWKLPIVLHNKPVYVFDHRTNFLSNHRLAPGWLDMEYSYKNRVFLKHYGEARLRETRRNVYGNIQQK